MRIVKDEHEEKLRTELLLIVKDIFNYHDKDSFPEAEYLGMQETFEKWTNKIIAICEKHKGESSEIRFKL